MEKKDHDARWVLDHDEEHEEEEALSFIDLPLLNHPREDEDHEQQHKIITCSPQNDNSSKIHEQQDFDFCPNLHEPEMCAADDLFFQGRIVPLRHSISYEREPSTCRSVSTSESMDYSVYSSSLFSSISSRSSSINSTNSFSSTSTATIPKRHRYKPESLQPRYNNQFQYFHPSPSPRLTNTSKGGVLNSCSVYNNTKSHPKKSSSAWNILKLGLVKTPPEVLSSRPCRSNVKNVGGLSSNKSDDEKKKLRMMDLFGGCKCSITSVSPSRVVLEMNKSANHGEAKALLGDSEMEMLRSRTKVKTKQMSRHRTFEWLKQLSITEDHTRS